MSDPQSGTPITDALSLDPAIEKRDVPSRVWREMAKIERALAAAQARITALTEQLTACGEMIIKLEAECDHLTDRAEQAESRLRLMEEALEKAAQILEVEAAEETRMADHYANECWHEARKDCDAQATRYKELAVAVRALAQPADAKPEQDMATELSAVSPEVAAQCVLEGYKNGLSGNDLIEHGRGLREWVIEKGSPAQYFEGFDHGAGKWTEEFERALKFASEEEAQRFWNLDKPLFTTFNEARICDHITIAAPQEKPEQEKLVSISAGGSTHVRTAEQWLELARRDLAAPQEKPEQGMVLVPKTPTIAMCKAGAIEIHGESGRIGLGRGFAAQIYKAMLEAHLAAQTQGKG